MRALLAVATMFIAVVFALIVLLGILDPGEQAFVWLENMRVGADTFQKFVAAVALIIGGIFAWYRFIRGERDPRLQPTVTGTANVYRHGTLDLHDDRVLLVLATVRAQNSGQRDVDLDLESCGLDVLTTRIGDEGWRNDYSEDVFLEHDGVQAGETLEDQMWFEIPFEGQTGVRLELTVALVDSRGEVLSYTTAELIALPPVEGGKPSQNG